MTQPEAKPPEQPPEVWALLGQRPPHADTIAMECRPRHQSAGSQIAESIIGLDSEDPASSPRHATRVGWYQGNRPLAHSDLVPVPRRGAALLPWMHFYARHHRVRLGVVQGPRAGEFDEQWYARIPPPPAADVEQRTDGDAVEFRVRHELRPSRVLGAATATVETMFLQVRRVRSSYKRHAEGARQVLSVRLDTDDVVVHRSDSHADDVTVRHPRHEVYAFGDAGADPPTASRAVAEDRQHRPDRTDRSRQLGLRICLSATPVCEHEGSTPPAHLLEFSRSRLGCRIGRGS